MIENKIPESLMSKLNKLLALRDGTDNPAEAANAAARIHELLTKHNLNMDDIEPEKGKARVVRIEVDLNEYQSKTDGDYAQHLFIALANAYYCQPIYIKRHPTRPYDQMVIAIIGRPDNAEITVYTGKQLINRLDKMESEAWRTLGKASGTNRNPFKRAYLRGAVMGIRNFLWEQRQREMDKPVEGSSITALVTTTGKEIESFITEVFPTVKDAKVRTRELQESRLAGIKGYKDGYEMGINKGIEMPTNLVE